MTNTRVLIAWVALYGTSGIMSFPGEEAITFELREFLSSDRVNTSEKENQLCDKPLPPWRSYKRPNYAG